MLIKPGIDVPSGGLGLIIFSLSFIRIKSSKLIGYSVIGHYPVVSIYFSITLFSKMWPVSLETTGYVKASPVIEQNCIDILFSIMI